MIIAPPQCFISARPAAHHRCRCAAAVCSSIPIPSASPSHPVCPSVRPHLPKPESNMEQLTDLPGGTDKPRCGKWGGTV